MPIPHGIWWDRSSSLVSSSPDLDGLPSPHPPQESLQQREGHERATEIIPQLAVWPVSGKSTEATAFLLRLQNSCLPLGALRQSYESLFGKWARWYSERGRDPVSGPIADIANFLAYLHEEGYQSRSLNAYRSAISSVHDSVDGVEVGKHPVISRLLKGAYHVRLPLPRYAATWNVQVVLQYIEGLGPSSSLSLKLWTLKLVMLMALMRPSRSADLASLQLDRHL